MKNIGYVFLILIVVFGVIALASWVTSLVWNWLMPVIFGLPEITFIQALGLQILSSLLIRNNYTYNKKEN